MEGGIFFTLLTQPLYNGLVWLYQVIPGQDLGVAIIALTVVVKAVLWPLTGSSLKSQRAMQALQPKIKEVQSKYKGNKEEQSKALMALYKEEKVNPFASCLPLIIQIPILLALYRVLQTTVNDPSGFDALYSFITRPEALNEVFLGFMDLAKKSIPLAIIAGGIQYVQMKMIQTAAPVKEVEGTDAAKDESMAASMTKSMTYTMPIVTVVIGASLPAGVTLYWLVSSVLAVVQQWWAQRAPARLTT